MLAAPAKEDLAALEAIVRRMETAWNAMDGSAFAAPFADDADFVTIRGEHLHGRETIAAGHEGILRTIYSRSVNAYSIESARLLRPEVALVHVQARLEVPEGPLAGKHAACFSLVLTADSGRWEIASLHNTLVANPGQT